MRRYQLFIGGQYLDAFNSFADALAAGRKFDRIEIVDAYDGVVVFERRKQMPTLAVQGRIYIDKLKTRNRRPIKPATAASFESHLRNHVVPCIGNIELESFHNGALKAFVQTLIDKKLSPKSIAEIAAFTRAIVASVLDSDGSQVYPRTWNLDFVDAPPIVGQHQPTVTKEMIREALRLRHASTNKYRVIIGLLLASGIRIGELLALRCGDDGEHAGWDQENSLLAIRTSLWHGIEQAPKTASSIRLVDLSTPVNDMLAAYAKDANKNLGDYLFTTRVGTPYTAHGLHQQALVPLGIPGFHSMRRWRISHLKKTDTPERLIKLWAGHSQGNDITARYDKSSDDRVWRQAVVNRVGIGFELPKPCKTGRPGPPTVSSPTASPRPLRTAKPVMTLAAASAPASADINMCQVVEPYQAVDDDLPIELFEQPTELFLEVK